MASILKVQFPAGSPLSTKLMKFKAEKTVADIIEEITKQFNLGDPSGFLIYLPEGTECAVTGWADNKAALASFDLKHKAVVHLKRRYQVARVVHKDLIKNVLFDWNGAVGDWLPIVAKKFDKNPSKMHLYMSGSKEPLKNNLSLVAQGIHPGVAFDFRSEDDPVGQAMLSSKERIAIGLNQAPLAEGAKSLDSTRGDRTPSIKQRSGESDETKTISIVNLNASVKGLKKAEIKGFLVKQTKKKTEKRFCALSEGHLFYYKTQADSKPSGVLDLQEYTIKELNDDPKKKAFPWEMVGKGDDNRIVFIAASEKEKGDWFGLLTKAREGKLKSAAGARRPGPPPPPAEATKPDLSVLLTKKGSNPKGGGKVFGRPLPESVNNPDGSELPNIVLKCVAYIEKNAMDVEGIFRLSGSAVLIDKYVARLDRGEDVDLSQEKDPHAVAGLMKLWFRDMPEPLLTFAAYQNFLGASSTKDRAVQLRYLRHLVNRLPVLNRTLLIYLLAFLRRVAEQSEVNMMALHNLATVFAPNLLRKADSNALGMVVDTPLINSCFNVLLRDFDYVFGTKPIDATLTQEGSAATCCRALYDYKGESEDELSFQTGNIVKLIYERPDGWWIGEFKVGNFGRFPASYVKKWSAKQSESFTKRQQFKIRESNIKKQLEHELNQIKHLTEERDKVMQEIDDMNLRKSSLEREFFVLKKTLEPLLKNPIVFEKPVVVPQEDIDEGPSEPSSKGKKKDKKKDKKDKKKDKKDKKDSKSPAEEKKEEKKPDKKLQQLPSNLEGKTLEVFPKCVEEFCKDSEDHRKALQTVDQTKDNLLASLEMLLGALPLKDKKEGKKYEPLKFMIENIKTKTKGEAFTRAHLAEKKEDIIKDLLELRTLMKLTVQRRDEQFELGEGVDPASVLRGSGAVALPSLGGGASKGTPKQMHPAGPNILSELASVLVSTDRQAKALQPNEGLRRATTSGGTPTVPPAGGPPPRAAPPPVGGGRGGGRGDLMASGGGRGAMMAAAGGRGGMMTSGGMSIGGGRGTTPSATPTWERGRRLTEGGAGDVTPPQKSPREPEGGGNRPVTPREKPAQKPVEENGDDDEDSSGED